MEEFHRNFPSFENEYYRIEKQSLEEQKKYLKMLFKLKYPFVNWDSLQEQSDSTDDGCRHYKHMKTHRIYSWNFKSQKWVEHKKDYQLSLLKSFY
jgi:hypothetical protein